MHLLEDTSSRVFRHPNAVKRKYENKRVSIIKLEDGSYCLEVLNLDKEAADKPAVIHQTEREVLRISTIRLSRETLEAFMLNAIDLLLIEKEQQ